jgi:predicted acyl esterase
MRAALVLVGMLLAAGCVTPGADLAAQDAAAAALAEGYPTWRGWSMPRAPALYEVLPSVKEMVPSFDGVEMATGIFLPAIEGCEWSAPELPEACRIPVVMDAGPYYGGAVDVDKLRPPTVEWLVPRGYAVAQMSLRGTGESGGCLEFKNPQDAEDVSAVIDWLAAQPWSNGNVGMIGRSYDGTSAWAGAASGNPSLKTIVPISGAVDGPFLYFKNGTREGRAAQNGLTYWPTYATDAQPPEGYAQRLCRGSLVDSHVESNVAALTGDASSEYWQSRDLRPRILESYQGSVWVVHGLEDWNVNPSQAVPFINDMQDAGIEVRAWLGVWGHAYPDRVDEHRNVRWDWADQTLAWFDFYLKGAGPKPALGVEVEDSLFVWRHEASYPPRDAVMRELELSTGGALVPTGEAQAGSANAPPGQTLVYESEALEGALRIAGLPQLHVTVTPLTPAGGAVFAELHDVWPDGRTMRIGWAAMDLRHHAGGNTEPQTLTPGAPVVALMQFEPVDAHVADSHRLRLVLHRDGVEDVEASLSNEPLVVSHGEEASVLRLPEVERSDLVPAYRPAGL